MSLLFERDSMTSERAVFGTLENFLAVIDSRVVVSREEWQLVGLCEMKNDLGVGTLYFLVSPTVIRLGLSHPGTTGYLHDLH